MDVKQKRPPKTLKERMWAKKTIELGNATEAAMQVYDVKNRDTARSIGHENLSKLTLVELMEEKGITDDKLLEVLDEGLKANKVISARTMGNADEKTDDFVDIPDYDVRHKYLKTGLELKGAIGNRAEVNVNVDNRTQIINSVPPEELDEFIRWRNEQRRARLSQPTTDSTE
jgi:hypothetical protein